MTEEMHAVHDELTRWSVYALGSDRRAWPSTTLLGRVIEQGINGAGQSGNGYCEWPQTVIEVDRAVAKLGDIDRRVIKAFYGSNYPIEVMARSTGHMRVAQFRNVLRRARWRISGFLDGMRLMQVG